MDHLLYNPKPPITSNPLTSISLAHSSSYHSILSHGSPPLQLKLPVNGTTNIYVPPTSQRGNGDCHCMIYALNHRTGWHRNVVEIGFASSLKEGDCVSPKPPQTISKFRMRCCKLQFIIFLSLHSTIRSLVETQQNCKLRMHVLYDICI